MSAIETNVADMLAFENCFYETTQENVRREKCTSRENVRRGKMSALKNVRQEKMSAEKKCPPNNGLSKIF